MRSYVVISTMGSDRPGLAKEIAEFLLPGASISSGPAVVCWAMNLA